MSGYVYCLTNRVNGKQYVGITTRSVQKRLSEHYAADSYIGNALRKYGIENFDVSILEKVESRDALLAREVHWINEVSSFNKGYNLTLGGDGARTLEKLEIQLSDKQKRFVDFANKENTKPIDVNDEGEMARMIIINLMMFYLNAEYESVKRRLAKTLMKLKPEYLKVAIGVGVIDEKELAEFVGAR